MPSGLGGRKTRKRPGLLRVFGQEAKSAPARTFEANWLAG